MLMQDGELPPLGNERRVSECLTGSKEMSRILLVKNISGLLSCLARSSNVAKFGGFVKEDRIIK